MKALAWILLILLIAAVGGAGYFYGENKNAREELEKVRDSNSELTFKVEDLEGQAASLKKELEEQVAKISEEKEAEIQRLSETQEKLIAELKDEIEKKQIQITQLADRLSVTMIDKILFPSGKAELTPEGLKVLKRVGSIIKKVEGKITRVEGHTDNVPIHPRLQKEFPTNWELSTARATNVVKFLQEKVGIAPKNLEAVGLSQYYPVASNKTANGRSQNRRIEIELLPQKEVSATKPLATSKEPGGSK